MGFTLGIINAPPEAVLWNANFAEQSFAYTPMADSGWLRIGDTWDYPSDPREVTSLHIMVLDAENNILLDVGNLGPVSDGKDYVYDYLTRRLSEVAPEVAPVVVAGELLIGLVWWEGKDSWSQILETNTWPPNTTITTTWKVKNTGNESAVFKVSFMGLTSAGVLLSPGREGTLYLYPVTPSPGSADYTLAIIADDTMIKLYLFGVITEAIPEEYKGSIAKKELEYNGSRKAIPVY